MWALVFGVAVYAAVKYLEPAVQDLQLPLEHASIIRAQAKDKDLDPFLIAAVIYAESRFHPRTSSAGAKGLMQILPSTAHYIAKKSGGSAFEEGDLATPRINIAYGSFYLRYLLDNYGGNTILTLAAYNAGEGKLDQWIVKASEKGERFKVAQHIPFPETREYVERVLGARKRYRKTYWKELRVR